MNKIRIAKARIALVAYHNAPRHCATAIEALTATWAEKRPTFCQRLIRQVLQRSYGRQFDEFHLESAKLSAAAWKRENYDVPLENGSIPGDLLYRTYGSGGFGHVGIRIPGNFVVHNTVRNAEDGDAREIYTLAEFGEYDVIVRPLKKLR